MTSSTASRRSVRAYLDLVRFEHTLFALPFAYVGMLLAADGWPGWHVFAWVTAAMVGARTAAMALNRLIDLRIDALNPRTASRELPSGKLSPRDAALLALAGLILLTAAGLALNPLTRNLLPVALIALVLYSYTKRFTWLCHLWLGATIGAAAAAGWIAVTGAFAPSAWLLWLGVAAWIAGFDIIYGILDLDFDRRHGVHSIPARFGPGPARAISAALHLVAWSSLVALTFTVELGWPYLLALIGVAGILTAAHTLVWRRGAAGALASFDANLYVSPLVLVGVIADLLVR